MFSWRYLSNQAVEMLPIKKRQFNLLRPTDSKQFHPILNNVFFRLEG